MLSVSRFTKFIVLSRGLRNFYLFKIGIHNFQIERNKIITHKFKFILDHFSVATLNIRINIFFK